MKYPSNIQNLINEFAKLPTVGPKTAERFVFYLFKQNENDLKNFAQAIINLKKNITICKQCFSITEINPCHVCSDPKRLSDIICIVVNYKELIKIEVTGYFTGKYFVLGNLIDAIRGIKPDQERIKILINRLSNHQIKEVILAFNPNFEGETTALYLAKLIKDLKKPIKITRLARGLSTGSDLEYTDEITLANAIKYRNELN